jgi:hypothetical protein
VPLLHLLASMPLVWSARHSRETRVCQSLPPWRVRPQQRAASAWCRAWDVSPGDNGEERWVSRLEFYLTDPSQEPDMNKWETQLAFRLSDET